MNSEMNSGGHHDNQLNQNGGYKIKSCKETFKVFYVEIKNSFG